MIAQMATQIQATWQSILHVARLMDQVHEDYSVEASMAKLPASELPDRVASNVIEIHGCHG